MVAEGIEDSSHAPTVRLVLDRHDHLGSGGDRAVKGRVGVVHNHHHAGGSAAKRFGAEVEMLGRFVGDPELGATDGELSDYGTVILEKKQFGGVKGGFVELDRLGSTAYGQIGAMEVFGS